SNRIAFAVGGARPIACDAPSPLSAQLIAPVPAADLPGDLPLTVMTTGGTPPFSVRYITDDPYVNACTCGIFSRAGSHTLTAFVNDSLDEQTIAQVNVTLYPALTGRLSASPTTGPAPLTVTFNARASGGHLANPARTNWSFGDGTTAVGLSVPHTYITPGIYLAIGSLSDLGWGNLSSAYVIDVLGGTPGGLVLTANVTPALRSPAGAPVTFNATVSGGTAPYTYLWTLGDGNSAFGSSVVQTYSPTGCVGLGTCPLVIRLNVSDATGRSTNVTIPLDPEQARRSSGLTFTDRVGPGTGATPLLVNGTASVTGFAGWTLLWTFGDGGSATGTVVSHRYLLPGNYTLTEVVADAVGDHLVRSHIEQVTGLPRTTPSVGGGPSQLAGVVPYNAVFHVTASGGAGGPYNVSWNFGDGTSGNGFNTTHLYTTPGNYTALATATDRLGVPGTGSYSIRVYNVTWVNVTVKGVVSPVAPQTLLDLRVFGQAHCTGLSVPGCRLGNATFQVGFVAAAGGNTSGLPVNGNRKFDAAGWANFTLPAPATGGAYDFVLEFVSPGYVGGPTIPINVTGHTANTAAPLFAPGFGLAVLLVAAAAAGTAAAVMVYRRRRGSETPPTP
ncbi:MAG: PKD domain-containing protein, partial [Thermoplasmata archaeon]|nr:PKD domain-containing protein [Thermoplasmata archaeon]